MSERVLLLSTWYPSHQGDRGWRSTWAVADIVAELKKRSVSTVVVAARTDNHQVASDFVHGQLVISIPSYLVVRRRLWKRRRVDPLPGSLDGAGSVELQGPEGPCGEAGDGGAESKAAQRRAIPTRELWKRRAARAGRMILRVVRPLREEIERPFQLASFRRRLNREGKFDRVIIHGRIAQHLEFARRFWPGRVSICFHETDLHEPSTVDVFRNWGDRIQRVAFRSDRLHEKFVQQRLIESAVPYFVVASGVPGASIKPRRDYRCMERGVLRLVCVSSMIPRKNLGMLIRTLSVLEGVEWTLDLYGDGPLREKLEALVGEMGLQDRVRFHGFVPHDEVMRCYAVYDVFVLLSERETFGMVYTEALSQGLFVIASEGEGIDGIIRDGENGFLVSPARPQVLLDKLHQIARLSKEEEERFKDRIHESIQSLTIERISERYYDFMIR